MLLLIVKQLCAPDRPSRAAACLTLFCRPPQVVSDNARTNGEGSSVDRDATGMWWEGLARRVAVAVLASAVLSLLVSALLFGLPHGWKTAMSLADITLRTSWIAGFLVPATVVTHLAVHVSRRRLLHPHGRYQPRPFKRGGQHR
ncbi:hypothetical protein AB7952_28770 [Streptomyces sp. PG2]